MLVTETKPANKHTSHQGERPRVEVGRIVYYFVGGNPDMTPLAAVVTGIGMYTLCLNVLDPTSHNFFIRDGVRHLKDPHARQIDFQEQGGWDYTPQDRRIAELERQVAHLLGELGATTAPSQAKK